MIGRQNILNTLLEFITKPGSNAAVISLSAEAGMGKSTILQALQTEVQKSFGSTPLAVVMTACSAPLAGQNIGSVEALQPWAQLLAQLVQTKQASAVSSLVKNLAVAWVKFIPIVGDIIESASDTIDVIREHKQGSSAKQTEQVEALNQQQVFQQYINVLKAAAESTRIVLILDDMHWADESSLNLLFTAARQLQHQNICFVIAHRELSTLVDTDGQPAALTRITHELQRYELLRELELPPLVATDIDAVLRERYGELYANNDELEAFIARSSGGNALFVQSWLGELEKSGLMSTESGAVETALTSIPIPATIRAVLQERLSRLSRENADLLRYASVEGDEFSVSMLQKVSEQNALKLLQQLRHIAEDTTLIKSLDKRMVYGVETSVFQFRHSLLRELLYQSLHQEERDVVHELHCEAILKLWNDQSANDHLLQLAPRLAVHAQAIKRWELCAEAWTRVAEQAWKVYSEHECVTAVKAALAALEKLSVTTTSAQLLRAKLLKQRAEVHLLHNVHNEAKADLEEATRIYAAEHEVQEEIDCILRLATVASWECDLDACTELCTEALQRAREISYQSGLSGADSILGICHETLGHFAEAETCYRRAIDAASDAGMQRRRASALSNLGRLFLVQARVEDARPCIMESLELFREIGNLQGQSRALNMMGILHKDSLEAEQSVQYFNEALAIDVRIGDVDGAASITTNIGINFFEQQLFEEALGYFRKSMHLKEQTGDQMGLGVALHALGLCLDRLGEFDEALAQHERSLGVFTQFNEAMWIANAECGLGIHYCCIKDFERSEQLLKSAKKRAQDINAVRSLEMIAEAFLELETARADNSPNSAE